MTSTEPATPLIQRYWWPASVRVPTDALQNMDLLRSRRTKSDVAGRTYLQNVKVYATTAGLLVYAQGPTGHDGVEVFRSPINYDETEEPPTSYSAARAGHIITTDAGTVVVQPQGGCGCNFGRLKRWTPEWAQQAKETKWGAP